MPLSSRAAFRLTSLIILSLAFWVRLVNLFGVPVFIDESNHLAWAQSFARHGSAYPFLMDGKFLLGVLLAQFQVAGGSPLWQARAALALLSLISCAACIALGRRLGPRQTGLLAGLLYALLPFAVFHERQVLADPLMAHFGALLLVGAPRIARRLWLKDLTLAGAGLAAAILTKLTGVVYAIPLLLAAWVLPAPHSGRRAVAARGMLALGLAGLLLLGVLAVLRQQLGHNDQSLLAGPIGFVGCPALLCHGSLSEQLDNLRLAAAVALPAVPAYFGWPMVVLACLAWPASRGRARQMSAYLFLSALAALAAFLFTARAAPPRYYTFLAVPVTVLAAGGLMALAHGRLSMADRRHSLTTLAVLLLAALAFQADVYLPAIILVPQLAQLPPIDHWQYFSGPPAGTGIDLAALNFLVPAAAGSSVGVWQPLAAQPPLGAWPPLVIAKLTFTNSLAAYLDTAHVKMMTWQDDWAPDLARALLAGQPAYVVEDVPADVPAASEPLPGAVTVLQASYAREDGAKLIRVRRVVGAAADLRARFFESICAQPGLLVNDYQGLARQLAGQASASILLAYPPNQGQALAQQVAPASPVSVVPIGDTWPLDQSGTAQALQTVAAAGRPVSIAFSQEVGCDPSRFIETWLNGHLFRLGQQWFGAVRLVQFAPAGPATQILSPGARFGDAIRLERVELIDSSAPAGGLVRVRLVWQAAARPAQSLKVFVHLFSAQGIVAQHDGVPAGELSPTLTWAPGQTILDQFAIQLPPEAASGTYQLRVGLYDQDTQARLSVQLADGSQAEFYVGGAVTITAAP